MTLIGIDNGLSGGIALIYADGRAEVHVTPTIDSGKRPAFDEPAMRDLLEGHDEPFAFVEQVRFLPDQSSTAGGNYGVGHGLWRGLLVGLGIRYEIVTPQRWQGVMLAGMPKGRDTKASSILVAKRLFPGVCLRRNDRCRVDHDGMADALLIAEYGRRQLAGVHVS